MNELNKTQLTNKMKKLGKFIKENRKDEEKIHDKIQEIFPDFLENDIYGETENIISFTTDYEYTGRIPKKELLKFDENFAEIIYISGIYIQISVEGDDIYMCSDVIIEYFDKYGVLGETSVILKELYV